MARACVIGVVGITYLLASSRAVAEPNEPKQATKAQREAATAAFRTCREQESLGDATACWKLWLQKYRERGGEAEVIVAEEHAQRGEKSPAPPPRTPPEPGGTPDKAAPKAAPPSARTEGPTQAAPPPDAGEGAEPAEEQPPEQPPPSSKNGPATPPAVGAVLDFCALKPRADSKRFVKQRVVVFSPTDASSIQDDAAIRSVGGGDQLREVFLARFALERFHNVVTRAEGLPGWQSAPELTIADLKRRVVSTLGTGGGSRSNRTLDAGDPLLSEGSEHSGEADEAGTDSSPKQLDPKREAAFVAYSLDCADYVVVPAITEHTAEWKDAEVKTKAGTQKVKLLTLKVTADVGIFRRDGDRFTLVETLSASVPGMLDFATDVAAASIPSVQLELPGVGKLATAAAKALRLPSHLSGIPQARCSLGTGGVDGVPGLSSCGQQGLASGGLATSGIDERAGEACRAAAQGSPDEAARARVTCEVRVRAAQLARALQKAARGVDGWRLFAPLQSDAGAPGLSLGAEEGIKVGYGFQVLGPDGERIAYFKVVDVGPGGVPGIQRPSEMAARLGEAPMGARVEEYPQMGISVTPWFEVAKLTYKRATSVELATSAEPATSVELATSARQERRAEWAALRARARPAAPAVPRSKPSAPSPNALPTSTTASPTRQTRTASRTAARTPT